MSDVRFYLSLLLRRLHYVLILTALGAAVGVTLATILPSKFTANARLVVESEQIPGELAASTVQTNANEQLQIIQQRILTRETLLDLADRLNVYRSSDEPNVRLRPDEIVQDLRDRIGIRTSGGAGRRQVDATLVDVSFSAETAGLAASVTNEVVTLMLQENVEMRTGVAGQTLEFFEQEVARLDQELADRGAQIIAFQEANRRSLPDSMDFRRAQLAAAQERILQLQRDDAALRERREGLVTLFEATGQVSGASQGAQLSPAAQQLQRLREQYSNSLAVLSPENPRVRVMQSQIERMEQVVAEEAAEQAGQAATDGTPLSLYEIQLGDLDNQLEFLADRRTSIEVEMEALNETIEETPSNAIALQTLQRDYNNVREQYNRAVAARARAETGDMIEALSKGERISVIEQAVPPREPSSPDRPLLVVAGTGGGLLLGLALVLLLELTNTAVRRPVDIISKLDITPFATLPFIRTRRETLRRRALIAAAFVLVIAGIPAGLWAIDTYYTPLDLLIERIRRTLPIAMLGGPAALT